MSEENMIKLYSVRGSRLSLFFEGNWTLIYCSISLMFRFPVLLYFWRLSQTKGIIMKFFKPSILLIAFSCSYFSYAEQVNFGNGSIVTGADAAAFGKNTEAHGQASMVFGSGNKASGLFSTAFGVNTQASGSYATSFGVNTQASNIYATSFGASSVASGMAATAFGNSTQAIGTIATAFGEETRANARASTAIGRYSFSYPNVDPHTPSITDPLFIIGNGDLFTGNRSNALTVFADGRTEMYGNLVVSGTVTQSSDERLKENIASSALGLDEVLALEARTYTLIDDEYYRPQVGFIAQEVETVLPELVREDRQGNKSINYSQLTAVLVEAVKELTEALCRVSPNDPVCQKG